MLSLLVLYCYYGFLVRGFEGCCSAAAADVTYVEQFCFSYCSSAVAVDAKSAFNANAVAAGGAADTG